MTELIVTRAEHDHRGSFSLSKAGDQLGALTFTRVNPQLVIIDHTEVSDTLRGQGAGRKMLDAAVAWARETNTKIIPVCPYAKAQFDKDPSIGDVLSR